MQDIPEAEGCEPVGAGARAVREGVLLLFMLEWKQRDGTGALHEALQSKL